MSATLTWYGSGLGTKTGTTATTLITDLVALVGTKSADANFKWQVASSSTAGPLYIVLKRKDGSAGRILLVIWATSPAGNNVAILDGVPVTNSLFTAYFPAGNVDTPSNLTASSGTILGDDTGVVKVGTGSALTTIYIANIQPFYFDSAEAVLTGFGNPGGGTIIYMQGAGNLVVDSADNAYPAVLSFGTNTLNNFGTLASPALAWSATAQPAGSSAAASIRTNYGVSNRVYFAAWAPSGGWASSVVGASDIMTDTATNKVWFVPMQLLGQAKGEGFVLKLRQIAYGPGTVGPFTAYNTTGPVVAARQINSTTIGGNGYPWAVNFKL